MKLFTFYLTLTVYIENMMTNVPPNDSDMDNNPLVNQNTF